MRYHYNRPSIYTSMYGKRYICNHPVYNVCTLFKIDDKGLAVIQQRFDEQSKVSWWSELDPWLTDDIYLNERFVDYFHKYGGTSTDGLYPTVTLRQIMWGLKMKPVVRERWETYFDRKNI